MRSTCPDGTNSNLDGGIDRFLPAYLLAQSRVTPAKAERNGHAD